MRETYDDMIEWWQRRRYGLLVQASLAAVPAWSPIGESSTWYRSQLGDDVANTLLHQSPMPETVHHHRERWPHIDSYDDFINLLTFDAFDADEWAQTAVDAGMGYLVMTAKHYDGWCWWDAPASEYSVVRHGPRRNVLAEVANACERHDLRLGAAYALLDWKSGRDVNARYVDQILHPQLIDLARRYNIDLVRGGGHWAASGESWRTEELLTKLRDARPDLVVNDRFWASEPGVRTLDFLSPWSRTSGEWELYRPLGMSNGYNRAEPVDRLMTPHQIVGLLTEVVARGGHLLLSIGPDASGALPREHVERLHTAGRWVHKHQHLIEASRPWRVWGNSTARYLNVDDRVVAIETGPIIHGLASFPEMVGDDCVVTRVVDIDGQQLSFSQDSDGLHVTVPRSAETLASAFIADVAPLQATPVALFPDTGPAETDLAAELEGATAGDIVQLGEGVYRGPARIPAGVTVRGLGPERTMLLGGDEPAVLLAAGARLEHCRLKGGRRIAWLPQTSVVIGGDQATMLACKVDGHVHIESADHVKVSSCHLSGVVAADSHHVSIVRSTFVGMGWDCSIDIDGGNGHLIDSNDFRASLHAVRVSHAVAPIVRNNTISVRWWGVLLNDDEAAVVVANRIERTMRAIDVVAGADNQISGNAVFDGDSGCLLQEGAANTEVSGNHWERLRIGMMAWNAGTYRALDNTMVDIAETPEIVGP